MFPTASAYIFAEPVGTSGIIVDNVGTLGQDSNLYFTNLTTTHTCGTQGGGNASACALKVAQARLQ